MQRASQCPLNKIAMFLQMYEDSLFHRGAFYLNVSEQYSGFQNRIATFFRTSTWKCIIQLLFSQEVPGDGKCCSPNISLPRDAIKSIKQRKNVKSESNFYSILDEILHVALNLLPSMPRIFLYQMALPFHFSVIQRETGTSSVPSHL